MFPKNPCQSNRIQQFIVRKKIEYINVPVTYYLVMLPVVRAHNLLVLSHILDYVILRTTTDKFNMSKFIHNLRSYGTVRPSLIIIDNYNI